MKRGFLVLLCLLSVAFPLAAFADSASVEQDYLEKAKVVEASASRPQSLPGTNITGKTQDITVEVLEGVDKGKSVSFENDYTQVTAGEIVYVRHITGGFSTDTWSVADPYRLPVLGILFIVFLFLALLIGGFQGLRALASLAGSFVLIFFVLLPGIHAGYSPVLISIGVASLIIIVGSYITHGFNRTTTAAVLSMIGTVIITGLAAYFVIHASHLSGFATEENVYLNFNTNGRIDMVGLLFGGIMIGLLGVLYDIAIGQAIAVEELYHAGEHYTRKKIFERGMRIGREHIGALINTLAIAYVGTALPLLLLLSGATTTVAYLLNSEIFASEIIRILIGSIGLILAVPLTTAVATLMLSKKSSVTGHTH
ncbi:MAG: hypothetical protein JWL82_269 [Parcubacteria group bacterium]|nr:hypothetical protein [Parcubacteria group bacterium]